ncbi:4Fe-4S binding protein [Eubacterium sp. AF15-50]|nr:4Fe-4S binding protein [Eubacterium sp. AF16-48]RHR79432.1 4Fe-4S binding protein [Eubacterium sp. AF15-50]
MVLCLYTIVFGRFFCGFACTFGTLGDFVHEFYVLWEQCFQFFPYCRFFL